MKDEAGIQSDLKVRTRRFALHIIHLYASLPRTTEAQILGRQLIRSGTSVGAHYREGIRAKSDADLISKLEGALQELEETAYWLELLGDVQILPSEQIAPLYEEANQLLSIFVAIVRKVKGKG